MNLSGGGGSSSEGGAVDIDAMSTDEKDGVMFVLEQAKALRATTSGAFSRRSQAHRAPSCAFASLD